MSDFTLSGVPETMLQTLYARAKETESPRAAICDPKAVEIVRAMNYDFQNADRDRTMRTGVIARTILLDRMTKHFLRDHPGATVVNIACGLDTRCYRMEGAYGRWFNLDLPETMEVRRHFLRETDSIRQIACSATDERWASQVTPTGDAVLVIIEGLSMYLSQEQITQIFRILDLHFPHASVWIEVMNPWVVSHVKEKSIEGSCARFSWGISSGAELQALVPPFRFCEAHSLTEGMAEFLPVYKILGKIGFVRSISNQILVLEK